MGAALSSLGKFEAAEAHFADALRLNPNFGDAYNNFGVALARQGKFDAAGSCFVEALRYNPNSCQVHNNLGVILVGQGKPAVAAVHYAQALRLDPDYGEANNNLAVILATCPEAKYRDGAKAVELATRACELTKWKDSRFLGTLAAAYAEAGDFEAAVTWQTKAIGFLTDEQQKDHHRSRLALYRAREPYREASPTSRSK